MPVQSLRNTLSKTVYTANLIDAIKLPFRKEKGLYRSFYYILGFYPHDIKYYQEALMHSSMSAKSNVGKPINNERLEFLGDAILDAVVGEIVFHQFQRKREGFLTTARSRIVQRETLGQVAVRIGLDKLIHANNYTHAHNSYMAGNAFEAMIGAIYLDRGYDYCMRFMQNKILGNIIDIEKIAYKESNFKSKLLEWCQKNKLTMSFELNESRGEDGSPVFHSKVLVEDMELGRGKGYSKKESQQQACKNALHRLKKGNKVYETLIQNKAITPE